MSKLSFEGKTEGLYTFENISGLDSTLKESTYEVDHFKINFEGRTTKLDHFKVKVKL
jgi:hypothetical protein